MQQKRDIRRTHFSPSTICRDRGFIAKQFVNKAASISRQMVYGLVFPSRLLSSLIPYMFPRPALRCGNLSPTDFG